MQAGAPILRCALVPETEYRTLLEFFHAHNGHKGHHYTVGAKARARVDEKWLDVCIVNVTTQNVSQLPQEVQHAVEKEVMN